MKQANDPNLKSFVEVSENSHFPIQNLPFGIFSNVRDPRPRAGVAIGESILDLSVLEGQGYLSVAPMPVFDKPTLNAFMELGRATWSATRLRISQLLRHDHPELQSNAALLADALHPMRGATLHLPMEVSGFSDFMLSKEHSQNCVSILGGAKDGALWPNWHHLPMGYNSRASSVVVSGTPVRRPWGQVKSKDSAEPEYRASLQLDFELEMALVVGRSSQHGVPIRMSDAREYAFGVVLLNDWSARDIQQWEAQPLGPFNAKNLATSISPWIVMLEALDPFAVEGPTQEPAPLPYLRSAGKANFDAHLEARILPAGETVESTVCRSELKTLYWSFSQQLVHQTSAGCNVKSGDLLGTGTVSSGAGALGCLFEVTRDGRHSFDLEAGGTRVYLEDGDQVKLTGWCQGQGYRVGFGECVGRVLAAMPAAGPSPVSAEEAF